MATSNRNTRGDYKLEKRQNSKMLEYMTSDIYGEQQNHVHMFSLGSIPSKMYSSNFAYNHIDIESKMRNIRATDLEGEDFNPTPQTKDFYDKELFKDHMKDTIYIPPPFTYRDDQRFGFFNT